MGWFSKLFGTDKAVQGVLDTGKQLLDDAFYTDQERADGKSQSAAEVRTMIVEWLKNTQGQNLSRRLIALSVTFVWLMQYVVTWLASITAVWQDTEVAAKLTEVARLTQTQADSMSGAVLLILGFYFAAPKLGEIADSVLQAYRGKKV